jgi:uncharacterized membrane protein
MWSPLYQRGSELAVASGVVVTINFPVLPLFGLMAAGYALGQVFEWPAARQRRALVAIGALCAAMFVLLRVTTGYGDPITWTGTGGTRPLLSFFLLTKHPLSLLMSLSMIGAGLVWLGTVRGDRPWWQPLVIIGRTPMYFYLMHVPLIHTLAVAYALITVGDVQWLMTSPFDRTPAQAVPPGWGFDLPGVYLIWLAVMLVLYPSCAWLARLKARSRSAWLSYL